IRSCRRAGATGAERGIHPGVEGRQAPARDPAHPRVPARAHPGGRGDGLTAVDFGQLAPDLRTCRLLNGMWQVSGAHGSIDPTAAVDTMLAHHDAGLTTWDLADHYGPAEHFIGRFRASLGETRGVAAVAD